MIHCRVVKHLSLASIDVEFTLDSCRVIIREREVGMTASVCVQLIGINHVFGREFFSCYLCVNRLANFIKLIDVHADGDIVYLSYVNFDASFVVWPITDELLKFFRLGQLSQVCVRFDRGRLKLVKRVKLIAVRLGNDCARLGLVRTPAGSTEAVHVDITGPDAEGTGRSDIGCRAWSQQDNFT